jgi:hypothetical protein
MAVACNIADHGGRTNDAAMRAESDRNAAWCTLYGSILSTSLMDIV